MTEKQLIEEMLVFLRTGRRQSIAIEEYIELTSSTIQWTEERKNKLIRALDRSSVLSVSYSTHTKDMEVFDTIRHRPKLIKITYTRRHVTILT